MATSAPPTINTYISDMLAVEQHIATPLEAQIDDTDVQNSAVALRVVRAAHDGVKGRIAALESRLDAVGGHAGSPLKNTVSTIAGVAASAIDKLRKTEVSKSLRDDYTALCLASAGYTMLHATALGLGDAATASLAQSHLTDVATHIMQLSKALPVVVLSELEAMGVDVSPSVSGTAEQDAHDAWHAGAVAAATD